MSTYVVVSRESDPEWMFPCLWYVKVWITGLKYHLDCQFKNSMKAGEKPKPDERKSQRGTSSLDIGCKRSGSDRADLAEQA